MINRTQDLSSRQRGMSLIEVLVAILILSFGLLGFVGLQARAIQFSVSAEDSTRAALLANEIASSMELNQSTTPVAAAYAAWQARVSAPSSTQYGTAVGLPNGSGTVAAGATANIANITITWLPPSAASGAARNQYTTQFVLAQ